MANPVVLKKYANRRLYDTERSAYVTLNEVADIIREGRDVMVMDAKTKEDVTAFILTQVILEKSRQKNAFLPPPVLHSIIRYGDNILGEFFEKYFQKLVDNYLAYKAAFDAQFKRWLDMGVDFSGIAKKSMVDFSAFTTPFSRPMSGWDEDGEETPDKASDAKGPDDPAKKK